MSIKQDGARVRTAHDLEQKYNLAGMKRAFELRETAITKIDQILHDFVNTIIGKLENFDGLEDGHLIVYFYEGEPSLEKLPTTEWANWDLQINDLYYDRETGYAYIFKKVEGEYIWEQTTDKDIIKVLALANATTDAKDNKRRLFVKQPTPPYDNGDLWINDDIIMVCQIAKPEDGVYEEYDFIKSSDYTGDTLAIKIGNELVVLKGTVLKIIEDNDYLRVEVANLDSKTQSAIEVLTNQISTLVVDKDGNSMMTQTGDGWVFEMESIVEKVDNTSNQVNDLEGKVNENGEKVDSLGNSIAEVEEKTAYMKVMTKDGKPWFELGVEDSEFKVILTNTDLLFAEGNKYPAYMNNETMYIDKAMIQNEIQIGSMTWIKRPNRHVSFLPKGVI